MCSCMLLCMWIDVEPTIHPVALKYTTLMLCSLTCQTVTQLHARLLHCCLQLCNSLACETRCFGDMSLIHLVQASLSDVIQYWMLE